MSITAGAGKLYSGSEISDDFPGGVRVGTEGDGHLRGLSQREKGGARVNFFALFAQASSVQFDDGSSSLGC